ncbi:MAG: cytochrome c oxidase accessory protein CcoG, partial [Gammaproteobacteria bacterium]
MSSEKVPLGPAPELPKSLYEKSEKIYPREVHGLFAFLRTTMVFILLGLFYVMPWVPWGDNPAILFDLPARKFYIFWWTLWPQDFLYLTFLLMLAALALFFFTTLAGRLWCGYACPQTVWTELFMWIERKVEGNRGRQMKLDKAQMSMRKFRIKATKHTLWILLSLFTGFTFVAYFTPAQALVNKLLSNSLGPWETFWILFYGFATYGNAGFMREQVCKYMCPYARFQSAMFDKDTLVIAYDDKRGDPRGSRRADSDYKSQGLGDCINCSMCVQVCPTGIDIRDGLQYECIGCSACIDVCNDVMDKMGYEKHL